MRQAIAGGTRAEWSAAITGHVVRWDGFTRARTVMAYASIGAEVETGALLRAVLTQGKRLLLPRCGPYGMMVAAEVSSLESLVPGRMGIAEPGGDAEAVNKEEIDLILVPGLLFDGWGNRLGQGAGYYDRFLADYGGITCALAFSAQVIDRLETKPHDVRVRMIATERGIQAVKEGE